MQSHQTPARAIILPYVDDRVFYENAALIMPHFIIYSHFEGMLSYVLQQK